MRIVAGLAFVAALVAGTSTAHADSRRNRSSSGDGSSRLRSTSAHARSVPSITRVMSPESSSAGSCW
jgi:hypothetical protein